MVRCGIMVAIRLLPLLLVAAPVLAAPEPALVSTQLNCDALTVGQMLDKTVARDLEPTHSLEAAEAVLSRHKVPFERSRQQLTLSGVRQQVVDRIYTMPQGEPIILPNERGVTICVLQPSADSY
jgi:hypothetical protein